MNCLEKSPGVKTLSLLTREDEEIFRKFSRMFRDEGNCDFKDSWAYVLQATRNHPWKISGENIFIPFGVSSISGVVVPNYFTSHDILFELVHFFRKDFNVPVILKNVGLEEVAGLKNYGFSEYTSDEFWNEDCKYDDQTFPQRIFKIEDLLALKGHKYASLRRKLRRCVDIETRLYSNEHDFKYVRQLLQKQDEHMAGEVYASQRLFLSLPQTENTTSLVFLYNTRIVGFSLLDRISSKCAGLNGLIYDSSIRELSAHIVFESVSSAFTSGYSYINLQGSEYPGLDFWKRMFNPEISIEKIHLIYR